MARTTFVAKAQQRYATVPVIDPATGQQKVTPVMRHGIQRVTKSGRPVFLRITEADRTKPLPNRKCDKCSKEIEVGQPYKHISPKSGPYGGRTMYRCGTCPVWQVWEYSSSLSARLAQISFDGWASFPEDSEDTDEVTSWLEGVADEVDSLAGEKEESASNIEDGFGHETSSSQELAEIAESLHGWADEIRGTDLPDLPEPEEQECEECSGTGKVWLDGATEEDCSECDGVGNFTPDEPSEEQMDAWRDEVRDACGIIDDCPV